MNRCERGFHDGWPHGTRREVVSLDLKSFKLSEGQEQICNPEVLHSAPSQLRNSHRGLVKLPAGLKTQNLQRGSLKQKKLPSATFERGPGLRARPEVSVLKCASPPHPESGEGVRPEACPPICLGAPTWDGHWSARSSREPQTTSTANPLFLKKAVEAQRAEGLAQYYPVSQDIAWPGTRNS